MNSYNIDTCQLILLEAVLNINLFGSREYVIMNLTKCYKVRTSVARKLKVKTENLITISKIHPPQI